MVQANLMTVLGFELAQEDYDAITAIDFQLRLVDGIRFLRPEGPFRCLSATYSATPDRQAESGVPMWSHSEH